MSKYSITSLLLKNYRSYAEKTEIKFGSQITLIFGKGSVGKSTIIDAIQTLHASEKNDVDLYDKNYKYLVSKKFANKLNKEKKNKSFNGVFSIGVSSKEENSNGENNIKSIRKDFGFNEKYNFPVLVSLYSNEATNSKISAFDDALKYLTIFNIPIENNKNRRLKDFYYSTIDYFKNEHSWKDLHEHANKYKKELLIYLNKIQKFEDEYVDISNKITKAQKIKDQNKLKNLEIQRNKLFDKEFENEGFSPVWFPMINYRDSYVDLIKKGSDLKTFIDFIENNIKQTKKYLYKNNKLYNRRDLLKMISENDFDNLKKDLAKQLKVNFQSSPTSLAEFLCYALTEITLIKSGDKFSSKDFNLPETADKDSFKWGKDIGKEIALSPNKIFDLCQSKIGPLLNQIKTIRHKESFNDLIKNLSQYSSSATRQSEFHEVVEHNSKNINKWLKEFGYDFKIIIEKVGLNGETEILHQKNGFKVPADLGGSGAQYLLTYLTELLDSNENTILLEEPEKALHASLQIKLAKLFAEVSKKNQLVIETHSENLLLGILKEIRDKNIDHNNVKILYVYMEDGLSKVDQVELNDKGGFKSKWRDGFFTEKLDLL